MGAGRQRAQLERTLPMPLAERYRRFAEREARGRSPLYERFALGVAGDRELLELLEQLPPAKQQPNLLFAAVLYLGGRQPDFGAFRAFVLDHADHVLATLAARQTQTNEVGRCALLLPLLARLPGPLALVEVGASAGLCLLADRYAYDYGGTIVGDPASPVLLRCQPRGALLHLAITAIAVLHRAPKRGLRHSGLIALSACYSPLGGKRLHFVTRRRRPSPRCNSAAPTSDPGPMPDRRDARPSRRPSRNRSSGGWQSHSTSLVSRSDAGPLWRLQHAVPDQTQHRPAARRLVGA